MLKCRYFMFYVNREGQVMRQEPHLRIQSVDCKTVDMKEAVAAFLSEKNPADVYGMTADPDEETVTIYIRQF